mmetsp:Transcript_95513/g.221557  ORF Transcript_95513/g.221557 Transcript_95513/m.221557 type:complete len:261 (+) Transcript_95513:48-830(+)
MAAASVAAVTLAASVAVAAGFALDDAFSALQSSTIMRDVQNSSCEKLAPGEKIVYFIRHGEAMNNLGDHNIDEHMRDAPLTQRGKEQATQLRHKKLLSDALGGNTSHRVQLIVASPMMRTLETALLAFNDMTAPRPSWVLSAVIREGDPDVPTWLCNYGDDNKGQQLIRKYQRMDLLMQYHALPLGWSENTGYYKCTVPQVQKRFHDFKRWLLTRPESRIIVLTHGKIMYLATGARLGNCGILPVRMNSRGDLHPFKSEC